MKLLQNKRILIVGIANERSIAYHVAAGCLAQGAELILTYPNDTLKKRVLSAAETFSQSHPNQIKAVLPCELSEDKSINRLFQAIGNVWSTMDGLLHSAAFAPREALEGDFLDNTSRESFRIAHDISSYSFLALARGATPFMIDQGGSLITLTYLGSEKAMPHYNVMGLAKASLEANVRYLAQNLGGLGADGIRVNAISAGPIRTLAASGIKGLKAMLSLYEEVAPLQRITTGEDVAGAAVFLFSALSSGVTAEVLHVDAGFHAVALPPRTIP